MILGIDIGGTHTDAVCVKDNEIVATAKVITGEHLVDSIVGAIHGLDVDYGGLKRVVLSTTLSTNAIIEKKYAATGMIVSAGPGVDPRNYFLSDDFHLIDGAIDHRGREYIPVRKDQILEVAENLKNNHVQGEGVISKFSVRNPSHEKTMYSLIADTFDYVSMGHRMSGSLNFPRRLHTAYFNTAVMPIQERFVRSVKDALKALGITTNILFLKADGGTYSSSAADRLPVETILSGPAASMMGGVALKKNSDTTLILDVGGTTTDIGILIDGVPILEPQGVCVGGLKTLVRGLKMLSVGAGGDSQVHLSEDGLKVGPHRHGPPVCMGGPQPTPMDALCVLGEFDTGDRHKAQQSLAPLARQINKKILFFKIKVNSIKSAFPIIYNIPIIFRRRSYWNLHHPVIYQQIDCSSFFNLSSSLFNLRFNSGRPIFQIFLQSGLNRMNQIQNIFFNTSSCLSFTNCIS